MYKQHLLDQPMIEALLVIQDELRSKEKSISRKQQDYLGYLLSNKLGVNTFSNNRCFTLRPIKHWNLYLASDMDVVAAEETAVVRKLNKDAAAFKTNPTNTMVGGAEKGISTYFASSSCTASSSNQTKASGSVYITGQKGFTSKWQPTIA